jgi:hypothetical protein
MRSGQDQKITEGVDVVTVGGFGVSNAVRKEQNASDRLLGTSSLP